MLTDPPPRSLGFHKVSLRFPPRSWFPQGFHKDSIALPASPQWKVIFRCAWRTQKLPYTASCPLHAIIWDMPNCPYCMFEPSVPGTGRAVSPGLEPDGFRCWLVLFLVGLCCCLVVVDGWLVALVSFLLVVWVLGPRFWLVALVRARGRGLRPGARVSTDPPPRSLGFHKVSLRFPGKRCVFISLSCVSAVEN